MNVDVTWTAMELIAACCIRVELTTRAEVRFAPMPSKRHHDLLRRVIANPYAVHPEVLAHLDRCAVPDVFDDAVTRMLTILRAAAN